MTRAVEVMGAMIRDAEEMGAMIRDAEEMGAMIRAVGRVSYYKSCRERGQR